MSDLSVLLIRGRRFVAASVLLIGLSSAALLALVGLTRSLLFQPWPYRGADRIVVFRASFPALAQTDWPTFSAKEARRFVEAQAFDGWTAGQPRRVTLLDASGVAERLAGASVTAATFDMLGVAPILGRTLQAQDEAAGNAVLLSYRAWQRVYGGDRAIVGRSVTLDGKPMSVVGVMPADFTWWDRDVWFALPKDALNENNVARTLYIQARLQETVTLAQAQSQIDARLRGLESEDSVTRPEYRGSKVTLLPLRDDVVRNARPAFLALSAGGLLIVLVAFSNFANLLLRRSLGRAREFAVRTALGAPAFEMTRLVVTEALAVTVIGVLLGVAAAGPLQRSIANQMPYGYVPAEARIGLDTTTMVLGSVLAIALGVLAAFVSALFARSVSVSPLRGRSDAAASTPSMRRLRHSLVVTQAAIAFAVILSASQVSRGLIEVLNQPAGFSAEGAVTARLDLDRPRYTPARIRAFADRLEGQLASTPGVQSVGIATALPLSGAESRALVIDGRAADAKGLLYDADVVIASPGYFDAIGLRISDGRLFDARDGQEQPKVAVVNRTFATRFLPKSAAIGEQIRVEGEAEAWFTIVGIVDDLRQQSLTKAARQQIWLPFAQAAAPPSNFSVIVRASELTGTLVRSASRRIDPLVPVYFEERLSATVDRDLGARNLGSWLMGAFAFAALLLAGLGSYAVLAVSVVERTPELGLRLAIGASPLDLALNVARQALAATALGLFAGVPLAALLLRLLGPDLAGRGGFDPVSGLVALGCLCAVGLLAAFVPALRVARLAPALALSGER